MSLAKRSAPQFAPRTRSRGTGYSTDGAVEFRRIRDTSVEAAVAGSAEEDYTVNVDWSHASDGILRAGCDCPHFEDGNLCKHIWATLLDIDESIDDTDFTGPPLTVTPDYGMLAEDEDFGYDDDLYAEDDDEEEEDETVVHRFPTHERPLPTSKRGAADDWTVPFRELHRHQFQELQTGYRGDAWTKKSQVWYVLDVAESLSKGTLTVDLFCREQKKDGSFGKPKRLRYTPEMADRFDPVDRQMLDQLLACSEDDDDRYGYGYYRSYQSSQSVTSCRLLTSMTLLLLPRLAATGRLRWMLDTTQPFEDGNPVTWDDGDPWRFRILVEADDDSRQWQIRGEFYRDDAVINKDQVVLIDESGVLLTQSSLLQIESEAPAAWIHWALAQEHAPIPYDSREEFLRLVWSAPQLPRIEWPENLALEQLCEPPQPCLRLQDSKRGYGVKELTADASFRYGDTEVRSDDPISGFLESAGDDQPATRVRLRDKVHERQRMHEIASLPAVKASARHGDRTLLVRQRMLQEVVDRLLPLGWHMEAEGKRFRNAGQFRIDVQSGIDWFDLDAKFDFGGVSAGLPELINAVRRGDKYVELDDGSRGILPEEWIQRYGGLAELGNTSDGKVRFQRSQALLLDALVAEQENARVDRTFAAFRKKLRSFDGVAPRNAPRTFKGTLREYQRDGLGWFRFLDDLGIGGCLADDMGLGKTIQVLALLEAHRTSRLKKGETRLPSLIVVPKSLIFNWIDEAQRFTPRLKFVNYTGIHRRNVVDQFDDTHVILTTYGTLRRDIIKLKERRFNFVILDEAQAIKNASSQAAKASLLLQGNRRLALTGTPIENHLGELWSLFEFLNPGMLGHSRSFANVCKSTRNDDGQALSELSQAIAPFVLRRTKEQVLTELPAKTEQTVFCELSTKERKAYNELRDFYRAKLSKVIDRKGLRQAKIHVLEALLRLRQAACHPGLIDPARSQNPSAKIDTLLEQLDEIIGEGHKALVFSQFTSLLAIVRDRLDAQSVRYEYLDGKTRDRKRIVDRFQKSDGCSVFLISLKAGGQGLNLTEADYVFILDPWWNPAVEMQAIDRAHRIGQTQPVFAYRIIARDTVEEKVLELQDTKRELANAIITANDSLIRRLTAEDLQRILG